MKALSPNDIIIVNDNLWHSACPNPDLLIGKLGVIVKSAEFENPFYEYRKDLFLVKILN